MSGYNDAMIHRVAELEVREALADTPVVLIHGPRQAGKSTLAHVVGESLGYKEITLDDPIPREFATRDPSGFVASLTSPTIIDEIQRAPELFLALKASVDRDRKPGRFLLTGSANVLALPKVADSLAGRMAIVDLLPLSQTELVGAKGNPVERWFDRQPYEAAPNDDLTDRLTRGGFPEPCMRASANRREAWFADYVRTLLDRDVRDLANIEGLTQMPRVLKLLASRSGQALNVVGLSRDTGIPNTSLHRYLDLLKAVFLVFHVPAWSNDLGVRLIKAPKAYLIDSGLLCYLDNVSNKTLDRDPDRFGLVLESFVASELVKLCRASQTRPDLFHLRTVRHLAVDFVLEARGGAVVGVDVVPSTTLRPDHAAGLQYLKELAPDRFVQGIVLYLGSDRLSLAPDIVAEPIQTLFA